MECPMGRGKIQIRAVCEREPKKYDIAGQLVIVCHKGDMHVKAVTQMPLKPEYTTFHGQKVEVINEIALLWVNYILGYELEDIKPDNILVAYKN